MGEGGIEGSDRRSGSGGGKEVGEKARKDGRGGKGSTKGFWIGSIGVGRRIKNLFGVETCVNELSCAIYNNLYIVTCIPVILKPMLSDVVFFAFSIIRCFFSSEASLLYRRVPIFKSITHGSLKP